MLRTNKNHQGAFKAHSYVVYEKFVPCLRLGF